MPVPVPESLFDPLFWSAVLAALIPFITALVVRFHASTAVKSTIASLLALADAGLVVWKTATAAGVAVNPKVLILAFLVALGTQRTVYTQVVRPYRIPEVLPRGGLVG